MISPLPSTKQIDTEKEREKFHSREKPDPFATLFQFILPNFLLSYSKWGRGMPLPSCIRAGRTIPGKFDKAVP